MKKTIVRRVRSFAILGIGLMGGIAVGSEPPIMLVQDGVVADSQAPSGSRTSFAIMRLPNGEFAFYDRSKPRSEPLTLPDRKGRKYQLLPMLPDSVVKYPILRSGILANTQVIMTPDEKIVSVFVQSEKIDKARVAEIGLPLYLNVWIRDASDSTVSEPRMIWRGYNGSQMEYEQLPSGRILVPFGSYQPHAKAKPPFGRHKVVVQYSDDHGQSWKESDSKLVSPCYEGFNGANEGACEPAIEQLKDGRIWMLFRTQAGFLYESFSSDQGTTWQQATASRFSTSTGPPNIMRHRDGTLVVCWNNCEMPPKANGEGVYGGRDALHIAVSNDDGVTWRGFREIYLDFRRNENPSKSGDRGTAYPLAGYTSDGKIVVIAGQGAGGRNPIMIDPAWITETESQSDFSQGLDDWSVHKHYGPAKAWWRARAVGGALVANPVRPESKSLHVRKADDLPADGAVWNFPNGWAGSLQTRIWINQDSLGGAICLNDRFFDPSNDDGERLAVYRIDFEVERNSQATTPHPSPPSPRGRGEGEIERIGLTPNQWHDIQLQWNLSRPEADLIVDGKPAGPILLFNKTLNGVSYVRFRSLAREIDKAGFFVEKVSVKVENPFAQRTTLQDLIDNEQRYIEKVVPGWTTSNN